MVNFDMGKLLKKCFACHQYSLAKEICPNCGGHLRVAAPSRFSPQDKYGKYRRMLLKTTLTIHQNEE
jgi:H/ACA ribonucleoprotein complex subunit 3